MKKEKFYKNAFYGWMFFFTVLWLAAVAFGDFNLFIVYYSTMLLPLILLTIHSAAVPIAGIFTEFEKRLVKQLFREYWRVWA